MATGERLDRLRHRPTPTARPATDASAPADLLGALRADPGATDLRPVVKAMTRSVSGWLFGHPVVRTAQDAWELRSAMVAAPDFAELVQARIDAQCRLLGEALAHGDDVPPLYLHLGLAHVDAGGADDFLRLLPTDSVVQLDVPALRHEPDLCQRVRDRVRATGLRIGITGLRAEDGEVDVARAIAPDVLVFDVRPPLDYRDRLPVIGRLRQTLTAQGLVLMSGVTGPVDEWGGTACGADLLAGPYYDDADPSLLSPLSPSSALAVPATTGAHRTAFEMAAAGHTPQVAPLADVVEADCGVVAEVCRAEGRADVYVLHGGHGALPPALAGLITSMRDCGAAVTVLAPNFDGLDCSGIACARVDPDDPLATGWALVALLPDGCPVIAATDAPAPDDRRWQAYVATRDRELATRIASRVSERVGKPRR